MKEEPAPIRRATRRNFILQVLKLRKKNLKLRRTDLTFFWIKILRRAGLKHLKYEEAVFVLTDNKRQTSHHLHHQSKLMQR